MKFVTCRVDIILSVVFSVKLQGISIAVTMFNSLNFYLQLFLSFVLIIFEQFCSGGQGHAEGLSLMSCPVVRVYTPHRFHDKSNIAALLLPVHFILLMA